MEVMLSIICTAYNHEEFIDKAIDGFLVQQCNFKIEIIIHDDASIDHTPLIIQRYVDKYPNLIYPIFQKENQYSKGVNVWGSLINKARGKYIAICEGDDYWINPLKLQQQVDFLENNPSYSLCAHNALVVYTDSNLQYQFLKKEKSTELCIKEILSNWCVPTASIVFRKELYEWPIWVNNVINGDLVLQIVLIKKGKVFFFKDIMSVYRKHNAGLSIMINSFPVEYLRQKNTLYKHINKYFVYKYSLIIYKIIIKNDIRIFFQVIFRIAPFLRFLVKKVR